MNGPSCTCSPIWPKLPPSLPDPKFQGRDIVLFPEDFSDPGLNKRLAAECAGTLLAEGDSWFDMPLPGRSSLVRELLNLGRKITRIAKFGDTVDNMVYGSVDEYGNTIPPDRNHLANLAAQLKPKAVLFSGGGNDFTGDQLSVLINHKQSGRAAVRKEVLDYVIDYLREAYLVEAKAVWNVSPNSVFVTHGYAYAKPTGRCARIVLCVAGPWLKPTMMAKGYDFTEGSKIVKELIDVFNKMLVGLQNAYPGKFVHVDFRNQVGNSLYDWEDEMHLTSHAFEVAARYMDGFIPR